MSLKIRGPRVIDPANGIDAVADICIADGAIIGVGKTPSGFKPERHIDARGLVACPGFVDLGAHLREPGFEHKATIVGEARAAAASGFTTVCATPDTSPVFDTPAVAEHIAQRGTRSGAARVKYLGALTVGLGGEILAEMHALKKIGCVGVTNCSHVIEDTSVLQHALAYAASAGLTVFLHSEDYWLGRAGHMHEGATSTRLGVPGIPAAAEEIALHRHLALVHATGARAHFSRLSCGGSGRLVAAARRRGLPVSADVCLLNLRLTDEDVGAYDVNCHVRPPLRSSRDRRGLGRAVARGMIDAVTAHHEPHDADAKAAPFEVTEPGVSGYDTFLPILLELVAQGMFDLSAAITAVSTAPHRILGLDGGTLSVGAPGDLCVFDPRRVWEVSAETMLSAGKNTPFLGRTVQGRNVLTCVAGRIAYDDL